MLQPYPQANLTQIDITAQTDMEWLQAVILGIRRIRGEMDISPAKRLTIYCQQGDATDHARLQHYQPLLLAMAKLETIHWLSPEQTPPASATALVNTLKIFIPMAGLLDKQAELARLRKALAKAEQDYQQSQRKLANPDFMQRAQPDVVSREQQRLQDNAALCARLTAQIQQIERL